MARKEYYQQNGSWLSECNNEEGGLSLESGKPYTSLFGYGSWYDKYNTLSYRNVASGSISNTSAYNIYIGNRSGVLNNGAQAKFYGSQIKDNGTTKKNFIPLVRKYDLVAGMYDTVGNEFYPSIGSKNFLSPLSYHPAPYLESSGTQYIDTGIQPNNNASYKVQMKIEYNTTSPTNQIMGFTGNRSWGIGTEGDQWWECDGAPTIEVGKKYEVEWFTSPSSYYRKIEDVSYGMDSFSRASLSSMYSFLLFAAWTSYNDHTINYKCSAKLYYCKIYQNNVLIRDFIPVYNEDGIGGLYDKVGQKFYTNDGTGSFKYVKFVSSITSSGSQYINTGVTPSTNLRGEVLIKPNTNYITENAILGSTWSASGYFLMTYQNKIRFHSRNYVFDTVEDATNDKTLIKFYSHGITSICLVVDKTIAPQTANYGDTSDSSDDILLFWTNSNGTYVDKKGHFTLYSCKFWEDDELIREFIPCISKPDNSVGLYDLVEDKFYPNLGTGSFTYSEFDPLWENDDYQQIDYIESNGQQYIDTGWYNTTNDYRVQMTFSLKPDGVANQVLFGNRWETNRNYIQYVKADSPDLYGWIASSSKCGPSQGTVQLNNIYTASLNRDTNNLLAFNIWTGKEAKGTPDVYTNVVSTSGSDSSMIPMYLFAACYVPNGSTTYTDYTPRYLSSIKLYGCKITKDSDSTYVYRDFIPVIRKSDNKAGLYDKVNNVFYPPSGNSYDFIAGIKAVDSFYNYEDIEYISTNADSYIKTGIVANNNTTIEFDYEGNTEGSPDSVFGGGRGPNTSFYFNWTSSTSNNRRGGYLYYNEHYYGDNSNDSSRKIIRVDGPDHTLYKNGHIITNSLNSDTWTDSQELLLFARNDNGTPADKAKIWLYGCWIWDGDTLIRNYKPVRRKTDNVEGLYDLVTNTFYGLNETYSDYMDVEYVEADGNQYIDTEEKVKTTTEWNVTFKLTSQYYPTAIAGVRSGVSDTTSQITTYNNYLYVQHLPTDTTEGSYSIYLGDTLAKEKQTITLKNNLQVIESENYNICNYAYDAEKSWQLEYEQVVTGYYYKGEQLKLVPKGYMPKNIYGDLGGGDNYWVPSSYNNAKLLNQFTTTGAGDRDIYIFRDSNSILGYTGFDINSMSGTGTQLFNYQAAHFPNGIWPRVLTLVLCGGGGGGGYFDYDDQMHAMGGGGGGGGAWAVVLIQLGTYKNPVYKITLGHYGTAGTGTQSPSGGSGGDTTLSILENGSWKLLYKCGGGAGGNPTAFNMAAGGVLTNYKGYQVDFSVCPINYFSTTLLSGGVGGDGGYGGNGNPRTGWAGRSGFSRYNKYNSYNYDIVFYGLYAGVSSIISDSHGAGGDGQSIYALPTGGGGGGSLGDGGQGEIGNYHQEMDNPPSPRNSTCGLCGGGGGGGCWDRNGNYGTPNTGGRGQLYIFY